MLAAAGRLQQDFGDHEQALGYFRKAADLEPQVAAHWINLARAQANAEQVVASLAKAPLDAAGLGPVTVRVVTPASGTRDGERWDVSRSLEQVLAQRRR